MPPFVLQAARWVGDALLAVALPLPRVGALIALSVVLGAVLLLTFRWLTPQRWLKYLRTRMVARVYEMRIFLDAPRRLLASQLDLVWLNAKYILIVLPALLIAAPPILALFVRAEPVYTLRPLAVGEHATVRVDLGLDQPRPSLSGEGVGIEASAWLPRSGQLWARVRAERADAIITVLSGEERVTKRVDVGGDGPVSPARARRGDLTQLESREAALADVGAIERIVVGYPERSGVTPWWVTVLLGSTVVAFALRKPFGVTL